MVVILKNFTAFKMFTLKYLRVGKNYVYNLISKDLKKEYKYK